jgi:hypothetical protein
MQGSMPGERRGGRQPGAKNKRSLEREAALAKAAAEIEGVLGDQAFDGDAHALLMVIYKNGALPIDLRLDAARAAISFEKPRLSSVDANVKNSVDFESMSDDELQSYLKNGIQNNPELLAALRDIEESRSR